MRHVIRSMAARINELVKIFPDSDMTIMFDDKTPRSFIRRLSYNHKSLWDEVFTSNKGENPYPFTIKIETSVPLGSSIVVVPNKPRVTKNRVVLSESALIDRLDFIAKRTYMNSLNSTLKFFAEEGKK